MRALLISPPDLDAIMRDAIVSAGHDALAPLPPWRAGLVASERERFLVAIDRMMEAELLVAHADAHDTAWCASWMLARGRLVVLACRRDARDALPPMLAGNPSPWQRLVLYADADELRLALAQALGA
jgi:hypothetical protein